ncbi:hypothetical protein VIGAN_04383400 [Vigna angularis var. angularis]|uniref:Uncharacterized protein n=1 Tax=Vigna angularis var. angularis TaxID=157739 RepID=A0A0S3S066_PHAAN|nr:hypothetical protein VIGAN_04383400 [Vigna angularis var. angularis]
MRESNHGFASRAPSPQSCNSPSRRSSKHLHSSPAKNPNSGALSSNKGALGRGLPPLTHAHPSLHRTNRRVGPSAQSKASPTTPIATEAIAGCDVDFSLLAFSPRAREKLSRSSANRRLREPSLREPQTRMVTADVVLNNRRPPTSTVPRHQHVLHGIPENASIHGIRNSDKSRKRASSTPPSTHKILVSRDILPRIITVIQMHHHLQQACKSKNTAKTPFATYKRATLPFSRSWLMTV